jgi:hypothetical protein
VNYNHVVHRGKFKTFATAGQAQSFRFGVGSCAITHSNALVFDKLVDAELDLFIHMGDMHYQDISQADQSKFDVAYEDVFKQPKYRRMLTSQAIAYTYDDHDFGPNDADGDSITVNVARASYRKNVPHYNLVDKPIYQSWPVGRVLFILTDIISESSRFGTRMSEVQTQWFFSELKRGRDNFKLVVWVSSKPWIGPEEVGSDAWLGHATERERISNFIADNGITSLIVVAGDAHMLAIDNGENTDYTTDFPDGTPRKAAGFPILQAAPLDRGGSTKGGPFSHGCHSYKLQVNSHYGIVDVTDNGGDDMCVRMAGYRADLDVPVLEYSTCLPTVRIGKSGGGQGACAIQLLPAWPLALMIVMYMLLAFNVVLYFVIPAILPKTWVAKTFSVANRTRWTGAFAVGATHGLCMLAKLTPVQGFQVIFFAALFVPLAHMAVLQRRMQLDLAAGKLSKFERKAADDETSISDIGELSVYTAESVKL